MPKGKRQVECDEFCNPQLSAWMHAMRAAVQVYKLQLPNVVLAFNGKHGVNGLAGCRVAGAALPCWH